MVTVGVSSRAGADGGAGADQGLADAGGTGNRYYIYIGKRCKADGCCSGRKQWEKQWEKVGNWTQGEKRGRVSTVVLSAPLSLLAQEDP
eukprot:3707424-Pyramimonas_sp.AAC.1